MDLKNKKVFVTGAGGFIGSHLCSKLIDEGADVDGYLKRLTDNKTKSENVTKQSASKKVDKDTVKTEDKKAVNQN